MTHQAPPGAAADRSRPPTVDVWLAPEQRDFLDVLASKRREMSGSLNRSRDDARAAVSGVSATWSNPTRGRAAEPLTRLRLGVPDMPIESVLLQKLDATERRCADTAGPPRRVVIPLGETW